MGKHSYKNRRQEKGRREIHELARTRHSTGHQCHSGRAPIAVDAWISALRRALVFGFLFCILQKDRLTGRTTLPTLKRKQREEIVDQIFYL